MKYLILTFVLLISCCTQTKTEPNISVVPQLTFEQYRNQLRQYLYTQATYISELRESQYKAGHYGSSKQEHGANRAFADRIQQYTDSISSLQTLEQLTHYFLRLDCPNEIPLDPWSNAIETITWSLCESIAKKGTEDAYNVLQKLKDCYSDGAFCGYFRSLEWQYLRRYSQDPAVLNSRHGIFH